MIKRGNDFIAWLIILFGMIVGVIVAIVAPPKYSLLFLLPISFSFFSVLFNKVYRLFGKSVVYTIVLSLEILKNILIPFFMALGDGSFRSVIATDKYILSAVMLQIYESLSVIIVLYCMYNSVKKSISNSYQSEFTFNRKNIDTFCGVTFIILILVIGILLIYPILSSYLKIGILGDEIQIVENNRLQIRIKDSIPTLVYYFYTFLISLLRWIVPLALIFKMYITLCSERKKTIISLLAILGASVITIDTIAVSVFIFLSLSIIILKLYRSQSKLIGYSVIFFVISFGVIGLIIKSFGSNFGSMIDMTELANMLQAYFGGPDNIAVAVAIDIPLTMEEYLGNVFCFIPYLMYFFKDYTNSNHVFNQTFFGGSGIETQIIPTVGQCARCMSFVLAPLFTIIIILIAIKQEKKLHTRNSLFSITLSYICCICFSLSWAMYNASLCLQVFLNYFFPVLFLLWFSTKISFMIRRK